MRNIRSGAKVRRNVSNAFIYILLIVISVIWVFPFFYLIIQSLSTSASTRNVIPNWPYPNTTPDQFTFDNFVYLFSGESINNGFLRWYLNTLLIAVVVAVLQTIIVLMVSYSLSRLRFKGRVGLMKFMLIVTMFPGFLGMICIYNLLKAIGLNTSVFGLMLVYVSGSATGYYISKGFFDTITKSLDEAAMIDGASRNKIFWSIVLPLSKPIVIYTILTSFIGPWGDYMFAYYLLGRSTASSQTVAVGLYNWLQRASTTSEVVFFNRFCAGAVIVSIPIVILFFFLQRYYVEGVTGGAVKG